MLINKNEFLFPQTLDALATGCVMGICAQWPQVWGRGHQKRLAHIIADRLSRVLYIPLATELAEARESGSLQAGSPEARYEEFDQLLAGQRLQDTVFDKYKALAELPWSIVADWSTETDAMFRRLSRDGGEMSRCLGFRCGLDVLESLSPGRADLHENGSGVCVLGFSGNRHVAYKSRPMAADVLATRLAHQLNGELGWEAYRAPESMDMGSYGWQEFVVPEACENGEDVPLFFRRQGAILALLYLLGGVDFHSESMVAKGAFPVPVDLETLMQPVRDGGHSLTRSGMVPVPGGESDISALGRAPKSGRHVRGFVWRDQGKDTLRMEPADIPCSGPYCLPLLGGECVSVLGNEQEVVDSFSRTLADLVAAFRDNRDLIDTVAQMPIRYIHRPAPIYREILATSLYPENLGSSQSRRDFIEAQLSVLGAGTPPELFFHETAIMERGYIPTCHTRADSRDLWFGSFRKKDFFPQTTLDQVNLRLERALKDRDQLVEFLNSSLEAQA